MGPQFLGKMREGWDCQVWEELGWVFDEGLNGMIEGAKVGIG